MNPRTHARSDRGRGRPAAVARHPNFATARAALAAIAPVLTEELRTAYNYRMAADGTVEWQYQTKRCNDLWVLPGGNVLFNTGFGVREVTRDQRAVSPAWAPAGDLIAYVVDAQIWVVKWDARGFGPLQLTNKGPNADPAWSPDGRRLAFRSDVSNGFFQIGIFDLSTREISWLTKGEADCGAPYAPNPVSRVGLSPVRRVDLS